ncbi:MAG: hypothetical protein EOO36_00035 [Cytophagaceae bacterium]|nr:MAG: hypothetical protein EOO36_00035 [Cytophagaceae bacterium]
MARSWSARPPTRQHSTSSSTPTASRSTCRSSSRPPTRGSCPFGSTP